MYPVLYSSEFLFIPAWHTLLALGGIAAFVVGTHLNKNYELGFKKNDLVVLFLICYISGYFGSRATAILTEQKDLPTLGAKLLALFQIGPMTLYGGLLLALGLAYAFALKKNLRKADLFDLSMPAVLVGIFFGRIGCFLNGDDYGKLLNVTGDVTVPWWAVQFPVLGDTTQQLWRYPVQLVEALACLMLALALIGWFKEIRSFFRPAAVGFIALVGYAIIRFLDEFWRGDERGWVIAGVLSPAQFVSLLVIIGSVLFIVAKGTDATRAK